MVVATSPAKWDLALAFGADHVVDGGAVEALDQIGDLSGNKGPSAPIDFVGSDSTMTLGVSSLAPQGIFVLVGLGGGCTPLTFVGQAAEAVITKSDLGS